MQTCHYPRNNSGDTVPKGSCILTRMRRGDSPGQPRPAASTLSSHPSNLVTLCSNIPERLCHCYKLLCAEKRILPGTKWETCRQLPHRDKWKLIGLPCVDLRMWEENKSKIKVPLLSLCTSFADQMQTSQIPVTMKPNTNHPNSQCYTARILPRTDKHIPDSQSFVSMLSAASSLLPLLFLLSGL